MGSGSGNKKVHFPFLHEVLVSAKNFMENTAEARERQERDSVGTGIPLFLNSFASSIMGTELDTSREHSPKSNILV